MRRARTSCESRMREICTSGLTRGRERGGHWPLASHSVRPSLLYRFQMPFGCGSAALGHCHRNAMARKHAGSCLENGIRERKTDRRDPAVRPSSITLFPLGAPGGGAQGQSSSITLLPHGGSPHGAPCGFKRRSLQTGPSSLERSGYSQSASRSPAVPKTFFSTFAVITAWARP